MITASQPSWTGPFTGLSLRSFRKLVTARDHSVAEQSKNYRYSANHQVAVDADNHLVVTVGRPLPGNRNDCEAWEPSGAKDAVGNTMVIADGGYRGTGLIIPHRREPAEPNSQPGKRSTTDCAWPTRVPRPTDAPFGVGRATGP